MTVLLEQPGPLFGSNGGQSDEKSLQLPLHHLSPLHWCIRAVHSGFATAIRLYLLSFDFWFLFCVSHASFQNLLLVT